MKTALCILTLLIATNAFAEKPQIKVFIFTENTKSTLVDQVKHFAEKHTTVEVQAYEPNDIIGRVFEMKSFPYVVITRNGKLFWSGYKGKPDTKTGDSLILKITKRKIRRALHPSKK